MGISGGLKNLSRAARTEAAVSCFRGRWPLFHRLPCCYPAHRGESRQRASFVAAAAVSDGRGEPQHLKRGSPPDYCFIRPATFAARFSIKAIRSESSVYFLPATSISLRGGSSFVIQSSFTPSEYTTTFVYPFFS